MKRALQITGYVLAFTARLIWFLVVCTWQFARGYSELHPWPERAPEADGPPARSREAEVAKFNAAHYARVGAAPGARTHTIAGRKVVGRSITMDEIAEEQF